MSRVLWVVTDDTALAGSIDARDARLRDVRPVTGTICVRPSPDEVSVDLAGPVRDAAAQGRPSTEQMVVVADLSSPTAGITALRCIRAISRQRAELAAQPGFRNLVLGAQLSVIAVLPAVVAGDEAAAALWAFVLELEGLLHAGNVGEGAQVDAPLSRALVAAPSNREPRQNPGGFQDLPTSAERGEWIAELVDLVATPAAFEVAAGQVGRPGRLAAAGAATVAFCPGVSAGVLGARRLAEVIEHYLERPATVTVEETRGLLTGRGLDPPSLVAGLRRPVTGPSLDDTLSSVRLDPPTHRSGDRRSKVERNLDLPFVMLGEHDVLIKTKFSDAQAALTRAHARLQQVATDGVRQLTDLWLGASPDQGDESCRLIGVTQAVAGHDHARSVLREWGLRVSSAAATTGVATGADDRSAMARIAALVTVDDALAQREHEVEESPEVTSYHARFQRLVKNQPLLEACLVRAVLLGMPMAVLAGLLVARRQGAAPALWWGAGDGLPASLAFFAILVAALGGAGLRYWLVQRRVSQALARLRIAIVKDLRHRLTRQITLAVREVLARVGDALGTAADRADTGDGATEAARVAAWRGCLETLLRGLRQPGEGGAVAPGSALLTTLEMPDDIGFERRGGPFSVADWLRALAERGSFREWRAVTAAPQEDARGVAESWARPLASTGYGYLGSLPLVEAVHLQGPDGAARVSAELRRLSYPALPLREFDPAPTRVALVASMDSQRAQVCPESPYDPLGSQLLAEPGVHVLQAVQIVPDLRWEHVELSSSWRAAYARLRAAGHDVEAFHTSPVRRDPLEGRAAGEDRGGHLADLEV